MTAVRDGGGRSGKVSCFGFLHQVYKSMQTAITYLMHVTMQQAKRSVLSCISDHNRLDVMHTIHHPTCSYYV